MFELATNHFVMAGLDWPTLNLVAAGILAGIAGNQALYREAAWDFASYTVVFSISLLAAFFFYRWYRTVSVWI